MGRGRHPSRPYASHGPSTLEDSISGGQYKFRILPTFLLTSVDELGAVRGGCKLQATGLEDFLALHELHEVYKFNGFFHPQRDLQLIAEAKCGFIEALHRQNCPLWVAPERFPH
jgi:hypothetical protein